MIPELGLYLLALSGASFFAAAVTAGAGLWKRSNDLAAWWRPGLSSGVTALVLSAACLFYALLTDDFSVKYVAYNANTGLEAVYKFAAFWAGHEGSFFLWLLLSALALATAIGWSPKDERFKGAEAAAGALILTALAVFLIFVSNPFERLLPDVPSEGRDLNPILQSIGMIVHPPLLFAGYAGLAALGAAAAAQLVTGRADEVVKALLRRLTLVTWIFLTAGNALGSWWAYTELGWGGWWFWDPVENSSFVPWLLATALLHLFVARDASPRLTSLLCLIGFALSLLGAFLVRSGIVQSVHAFASDATRGAALFALFLALVLPAAVLYALRADRLPAAEPETESGAGILTAGAYLMLAAAASVLVGTLYPLFFEVMGWGSLSVGVPYFNAFFAPMTVAAALMIGWLQARRLTRVEKTAAVVVSLAAGAAAVFLKTEAPWGPAAGAAAAVWLAVTGLAALWQGGFAKAAVFAHLGIAVSIAGVTGVANFETDALVRMGPGLGKPVADVIFVYDETRDVETRGYRAKEAQILVLNEREEPIGLLTPQRQVYKVNGQSMSAAGIQHGLWRDLYVSMGNDLGQGEYLVRLSVKPLVSWIWAGALVMLLGGLAALRRKENTK